MVVFARGYLCHGRELGELVPCLVSFPPSQGRSRRCPSPRRPACPPPVAARCHDRRQALDLPRWSAPSATSRRLLQLPAETIFIRSKPILRLGLDGVQKSRALPFDQQPEHLLLPG